MQTLVSNLPWCLLTSILPEKSTFFRFQTQPMCADRPVSLLNINICMSKMLHIFKWFAKWKLCELMLDSCFIPKPLKQPSFHFMNVFFCFCSQTLFVLRPTNCLETTQWQDLFRYCDVPPCKITGTHCWGGLFWWGYTNHLYFQALEIEI